MRMQSSFQDQGSVANCFGCGADNPSGLQLKSFWDGEEAIARFTPQKYHCGGTQSVVYGGLIASLMDCHACNFAIAHQYRMEDRDVGTDPKILCVTAQLNITLMKPAPMAELLLRARLKSIDGRKIWIDCELSVDSRLCARGDILVVRLQENK